MKGWVAVLVLCFWACAERDNPYDPANRSTGRIVDTGAKPPVPSESVRVVLLDSSGYRGSAYYGSIGAALADLNPGDTLWVQGNKTYPINDLLRVSHGGARLLPVVIRSFGGVARILARGSVRNCLFIDTGAVDVHISGFAFVGATGPAVIASGGAGGIWIDSCRIDTSYTAIEMRNISGSVHVHDVTMTADSLVPPVSFQNIGLLDTARLHW